MASAIFDFTLAAPTVDRHIQEALQEMYPRVFLRWSKQKSRWEIWVELADNSHPGNKFLRSKKDRWCPEAKCWLRFLQTYQYEDGSYAPVDERLLLGLRMADTWERGDILDELERREESRESRKKNDRLDLLESLASHYRNYINPTVGYGSKNPGWRRGLV